MNWSDHESFIRVYPPKEFNFDECLAFLGRSDQEVLHRINGGHVFKLIKVSGALVLFKVEYSNDSIIVEFLTKTPAIEIRNKVAAYIWDWFDLDCDLDEFYNLASQDKILRKLAQDYFGLRMISIQDLFEALTWAILGQQINLTFAYTLKRRFVERFGECLTYNGDTFWLFPSFEQISSLDVKDLRILQITGRKSEYIIGIANAMKNGELTKDFLKHQQDDQQTQILLMQYRGVGAWTANYVMMKCLHNKNSFPIADVGLHHAIKHQLGLERKPTIKEIEKLSLGWKGWQAYATFYLWRSLYDSNYS
ncbi:DNA-3-methyladenine glycosylase family protein [Virgibacillus oceani]|uniref:DNA-3-methyladenine glycosylase II n=1 Tax=Virgibacillus oceani TaxID=1479511 RepID=A0A917M4N1_9BACI|nr:DNA-3-methyladenine glycosylase [Virgibacillus oceani]GGG77069.1 DNA-3-methyladenine glycosylase [Virgibacillus oceani]